MKSPCKLLLPQTGEIIPRGWSERPRERIALRTARGDARPTNARIYLERIAKIWSLLLLAQLCAVAVRAQGVFQDLDFESANVILDTSSPYYPNAITAANAFPGWTVTGSVTAPDVFYNDVSLGAPAISLQGPGSLEPVLQGSFSAFLQGSSGSGSENASIAQTGQIPAGSESLVFYGGQVANLQVTFKGQVLPYLVLGSSSDYTIYGADITALAGQSGTLAFTALPDGEALLDNIQFSPNPIPEPSTWMLWLVGVGTFGVARCAHRRKSSGRTRAFPV